MKRQTEIVVIGGTACGPKAAARAQRCDPHCKITIIEQAGNLSSATCGFPYYVSRVIEDKSSLVAREPDYFKDVFDIDVLINTRAVAIDRKAHRVDILNLETGQESSVGYDKLVLATGSLPLIPELAGKQLNGIFTMNKIEDAYTIHNLISAGKTGKVVVVGAGLIGLEMTEAFVTQGLEVTVVEALDWVLPTLLDFEIAAHVEKHLKEKGVNLIFGQRVTGFEGDGSGKVSKVITGEMEIPAGTVLLALGNKPNITLAKDAGLDIGSAGGVSVNRYLQTSDPDIYAGGDCVENINRITGQKMLAPMGSTANKHGRVIGTNITGGQDEFPGVLGTAVVKVFDFNVARVGLNEAQARQAGYDVVTSLVPADEHASYYPGAKEILVKLVADKADNRILGGQVVGPGEAAKRIDVLASALTFGAKTEDLANLDLAYAPPYNSAMDPLHNAANVIRNKQSDLARTVTPLEVNNKIEQGENFIFLDVRNQDEWETEHIKAPQARLIPIEELRKRVDQLPRDAEIVAFCRTSIRAYQAQRILESNDFTNCKFMDGSIRAWPYAISATRQDSEK